MLSQISPVKVSLSYLRSILILSYPPRLGFKGRLFRSVFPIKKACTLPASPRKHATNPTHLILLYLITLIYLVRSTSHEFPHCLILSILLLRPTRLSHIYSSAPSFQTPSACDIPLI
jgi:hypothetical protein